MKSSTKVLALIIFGFIFIRSIHFSEYLNFSSDQASFSSVALKMWQTKEFPLVGPTASIHMGERYINQGAYIYYIQLLFLLLGNFDPIRSSYIFMLFCALMVIPLYIGSKLLIGKNAALFLIILYSFFPFYIQYTAFLWNPNFQFSLLPIAILFLGLLHKTKRTVYFFVFSLILSILVQLHFQLFPVIVIILEYFLVQRVSFINFIVFVLAFVIGFIPYLRYEFTHKFINFDTLKLFIEHLDILYYQNQEQTTFAFHYLLSLSFILFFMTAFLLRSKINKLVIFSTACLLISYSLYLNIPMPQHAQGMAENWNFLMEEKAHKIIVNEKIDNFNVVNLKYDTLAKVQKYLLLKDKIVVDDNYSTNKYLFVITDRYDFFNHPPYEVNTFNPSKIIKNWQLNFKYKLYLLQRQA